MKIPTDFDDPGDVLEELVATCLETPPDERPTTVDRLCGEHPEMAGALRRRLAALDRALGELATPLPEVPERLGEYRILRELGGGGMGVVYEAEQESLGRVVALKLIRPEHLWFDRARERFRREVEAVAALEHPGVVPVLAVGEERGVPYFTMERLRGCTLAEALRALSDRAPESLRGEDLRRVVGEAAGEEPAAAAHFGGRWTDACVEIVRRVAEALHHAHRRGLVHRDVKPSNVLLTADGRVLLFDFGLTPGTGDERVTRSGALMGTLPYMSPEQVRDPRKAGPSSDVYALGVTLYECLTLQLPYEEGTAVATQGRILEGDPDPIHVRNRRVAVDLETVCTVAMEVEPQRRYADAAALAGDLRRIAAREPIAARPPGPLLRLRRWVQRHPVLTTAGFLGAALVGGIPTALYSQERAYAAELAEAKQTVSAALAKEQVARAAETEAKRAVGAALVQEQEARAAEAEAAARAANSLDFLIGLFSSVTPERRPEGLATVVDLLDLGVQGVAQELADHPQARGRMELRLGTLMVQFGKYTDSIEVLRNAVTSLEQCDAPERREWICEARLELAMALQHAGDWRQSDAILREEIVWAREAQDERLLAMGLARRAGTLTGLDQFEQADEIYAELIPLLEGDHPMAPLRGNILLNHGLSLTRRGRKVEAEVRLREAIAFNEENFAPPHQQLTLGKFYLADLLGRLGPARAAEAEELYRRCIEEGLVIWGETHLTVCAGHSRLARLLDARGEQAAAEAHARKGLELTRAAIGEVAGTANAAFTLGLILARQGKFAEAAVHVDEMLEYARTHDDLSDHDVASAYLVRGRAHEVFHEYEEARLAFQEAHERFAAQGDRPNADLAAVGLARLPGD